MSKGFKVAATLGLVGLVAACGQREPQQEVVYTQPAPVEPEPTYNKY